MRSFLAIRIPRIALSTVVPQGRHVGIICTMCSFRYTIFIVLEMGFLGTFAHNILAAGYQVPFLGRSAHARGGIVPFLDKESVS